MENEPDEGLTPQQKAIINAFLAPFMLQRGVELLLASCTKDERRVCDLYYGLYESDDPRRWLPDQIASHLGKPVSEVCAILQECRNKMVRIADTSEVQELYKRIAPRYGFPPLKW